MTIVGSYERQIIGVAVNALGVRGDLLVTPVEAEEETVKER